MPNTGEFELQVFPKQKTISMDSDGLLCEIVYTKQKTVSAMSSSGRLSCVWYAVNDRTTVHEHNKPYIMAGPKQIYEWVAKWDFPGNHTVVCVLTNSSDPDHPRVFEHSQWVESTEAILGQALMDQRGKKSPNPDAEISTVRRYAEVLVKGEAMMPTTDPVLKKKHDDKVAALKLYSAKLSEQMQTIYGRTQFPVYAVHLEKTSQKRVDLRIQIGRVRNWGGSQTWHLIDWTNPTVRELTGVYEGIGSTAQEAIEAAIDEWDAANRYIDGSIAIEVPKDVCGELIERTIETNGASYWDSVSKFFELVALGATVVAGVITLIIPEPGSKVISAMIWTTLFSSATAAAINIGQRYDEGFGSWRADAMDGLTILASIFGGLWLRGGTAKINTLTRGEARFHLIGQVSTDGVHGILIAEEKFAEYQKIMADTKLSADQRSKKLLKLFHDFIGGEFMIYVSMKGTKKDLDYINSGHVDKAKLEQLKDPNSPEPVDFTKTPKVVGEVEEGKILTKKQDEQRRHETPAPFPKTTPPPPRRPFPPGLPATKRGMRARDHRVFSTLAKGEDKIIIVRNSNPAALKYIGMPGFKPKPANLKAKTRKTPPNPGLAAIDPMDPEFGGDLAKWQKAVDELPAGYKIGDATDGYIIREKATGSAFHSDYDLHGVYDAKTGYDGFDSIFQKRMNDRMGNPNVQHPPHDKWPDRDNFDVAKRNYGPQPPCTAYMPDGKTVHLQTVEDMRAFYKQNHIDFDGIYNAIDWVKYNKMHTSGEEQK